MEHGGRAVCPLNLCPDHSRLPWAGMHVMMTYGGLRCGFVACVLYFTALAVLEAGRPLIEPAGASGPKEMSRQPAQTERDAGSLHSRPIQLGHRFSAQVQPFVQRDCSSCHGSKKPKAHLDLSRDTTIAKAAEHLGHWQARSERIQAKEMPLKVHPSSRHLRRGLPSLPDPGALRSGSTAESR